MHATHDPEQRQEKVSGLIERFRTGEFSESVFTASLKAVGLRPDDIRELTLEAQGQAKCIHLIHSRNEKNK